MYAVIKAGGKQHRVQPGDVIEIELMHAKDDEVEFHPLLVVDDDNKTHVGKEVAKAVVTGKLVGEQKGEKVKVFKYRNKTGYARHTGHRQMYTLVEIGEIKLPGQPAAKKAEAASDGAESKPAAKSTAKPKSSAKTAATKTADAKTVAAAEPAASEEAEDTAADAAPAETPPAEVAEVAAEAETGPDADESEAAGDAAVEGDSETEAEAEAEAGE